MAGMRDRTAVYILKKALFDKATTVYAADHPEFLQSWGEPVRRPATYAQWVDGSSDQAPGPMGNRARDETVTVAVEMYCQVPGEIDAARTAEEYILDRLGEIEHDIRNNDPTVGGVAMWCFLTRVAVDGADLQRINQQGRLAVLRAEFTARIRITG